MSIFDSTKVPIGYHIPSRMMKTILEFPALRDPPQSPLKRGRKKILPQGGLGGSKYFQDRLGTPSFSGRFVFFRSGRSPLPLAMGITSAADISRADRISNPAINKQDKVELPP